MKKYFICLLFLGLAILPIQQARSQDNLDYFVGFFGERISPSAPVGHAFIGIGKGVPLTCNIDGTETEMFGFYPTKRIDGAKSFWFGPVPGSIKNDVRSNTDNYVFKKINFSDYIRVQLKMEEWKNKQYEVTRQDCISFFQEVAKLFDDIVLPDRTQFVTPETYVSQFIVLNRGL